MEPVFCCLGQQTSHVVDFECLLLDLAVWSTAATKQALVPQ
jgi:hypothetical protein